MLCIQNPFKADENLQIWQKVGNLKLSEYWQLPMLLNETYTVHECDNLQHQLILTKVVSMFVDSDVLFAGCRLEVKSTWHQIALQKDETHWAIVHHAFAGIWYKSENYCILTLKSVALSG